MQNVEIKAELRDLEAARACCRSLGAKRVSIFEQIDTYFKLPDGRLKRRESQDEPTEWIFYHRKDRIRATLSTFTILSNNEARDRWSVDGLDPWLVVRKKRELWMIENVRIHLDEVDELGIFLELEALVDKFFPVKECQIKIAHLQEQFQPVLGELISVGYSDLLGAGPLPQPENTEES